MWRSVFRIARSLIQLRTKWPVLVCNRSRGHCFQVAEAMKMRKSKRSLSSSEAVSERRIFLLSLTASLELKDLLLFRGGSKSLKNPEIPRHHSFGGSIEITEKRAHGRSPVSWSLDFLPIVLECLCYCISPSFPRCLEGLSSKIGHIVRLLLHWSCLWGQNLGRDHEGLLKRLPMTSLRRSGYESKRDPFGDHGF